MITFPLRPARLFLTLGLLAGLSACGSSASISKSDPNFFSARMKNGKLTGSYNPAGFDQAKVRALLGANCSSGKLASYGETAAEGLTAFTATCRGGMSAAGGHLEFEKDASGNIVTEATTFDKNGNISTARR